MGMYMVALRVPMGGWLMAAITYPWDQLWRLQLIPFTELKCFFAGLLS